MFSAGFCCFPTVRSLLLDRDHSLIFPYISDQHSAMNLVTLPLLLLLVFAVGGVLSHSENNYRHEKRRGLKGPKSGKHSHGPKSKSEKGKHSHDHKSDHKSGKKGNHGHGHHKHGHKSMKPPKVGQAGFPSPNHGPYKEDLGSYARHEYNAHQDEKLVETKCSTVEDRVPCNFPFADEKGLLFVCSTFQGSLRMFSREESICIPANEIAESDVCGCCEGSCPETCMCTCDMKNGSVGVKVERRDALLSYQECVPPDIALRMVDRLGDVACIADCTDTLVEEASI